MKKPLLWFIIGIFFLALGVVLIQAQEINQFTNGLSGENITITGYPFEVRYIDVPLLANVTNLEITFQGHHYNSTFGSYFRFNYTGMGDSTPPLYGYFYWNTLAEDLPNAFFGHLSNTTNYDYLYCNTKGSWKAWIFDNPASQFTKLYPGDYCGIYTNVGGNNNMFTDIYTGLVNALSNNASHTFNFTWRGPTVNVTEFRDQYLSAESDISVLNCFEDDGTENGYIYAIDTGTAEMPQYGQVCNLELDDPTKTFNLSLNATPSFASLTIGSQSILDSDNWDWNTTLLNETEDLTLNASKINELLENCSCDGCSIIETNCRIPWHFQGWGAGIWEYRNLNLTYNPSFGIQIIIRDEQTEALITENVSILYIGEDFQDTKYTNTGYYTRTDLDPGSYELTFSVVNESKGYDSRRYVITIADREPTTLTAYLNQNTTEVTFSVLDKDTSEPLESVLATMYRYINTSYQVVESHFTDLTGRVKFDYQEDVRYRFYFAKSSYQDYIFFLDPVLFSEYEVKMTRDYSFNQSQDYDNIALIYAPTLFYDDQENNFTFLIQSPGGELINYGYALTFPGGTSNKSGSDSLGSQLFSEFNITGSEAGDTLKLNYFYNTNASGIRNFTFYYPIVLSGSNQTMIGLRNKTYGMGIIERILIMVFGAILIVGIATLIGRPIPGMALGLIWMGILVYIWPDLLWSGLISLTLGLILLGSQSEV